jgi:two-component system CheB/CheR fusion protein
MAEEARTTYSADFVVVGIGASAGGIQAIKRFFEQVPRDSGMAFVVVLHLSPQHESRLAEVLQVSSGIPVNQVQGRVRVEPNHVYVTPPQRSLSMEGGYLACSEVTRFEERRAPVDIFFRTLADSHHSRAVCVVLSGTGANGSMGLKRVKEQGGICLVQDPNEAGYADMPLNSIATGLADHVLPVAEMPARIMAYRDSLENVQLPEQPIEQASFDEQSLRDILSHLRTRTGHDFANYKRPTVLRRIGRRMSLHQISNVGQYAQYVRDNPQELQGLLKDLLISVTNFFRDREAFETLERLVIPRLFARKGEEDQVRVWIVGCATGEEAYSIGMLLAEYETALTTSLPSIQVFATDIDAAAIAAARQGIYTLNDAADVSPERLRRFFSREGESYRVRQDLREMILFADHNVIKDPPFSHLDLVTCRNLLIYLNRTAQQRVMEVMHFALNPGGYLFLGSSESIEGSGDLFVTVDKDAHIFESRAVATRFAVGDMSLPSRAETHASRQHILEDKVRPRLSVGNLHQRLLEQYAPPSIVVNEEHDIMHLSEHAGRYLQYAGGEPTHNLLKAIRPELRIELRTAFYQATQRRTSVETSAIGVRIDDRSVLVKTCVRPVLREDDTARGFFLVLFQEIEGAPSPAEVVASVSSGDAVGHLEDELVHLKAQLNATVERHETQAEELKASNEELQAMNEELRSAAEELETSKEELQSVNEELHTVNQELKIRIEEQTQANDDIRNLINSTEFATIFLDRGSRIKLFTLHAREIFTVLPSDRGRPLSDMASSLVDVNLQADIDRVLEHLERVEREVRTRDGRWYLMRVVPYRTSEDRIDGVVLTFVDITTHRRTEEQLRRSEGHLSLIMDSVTDSAIFTVDAKGRINSWNPGAARVFGFEEQEALGQSMTMLFTPQDRSEGIFLEELRRADVEGRLSDERWHARKDGSRFFASGVLEPLRDASGMVVGYVRIARDLTERKRWEDSLREAHAETEAQIEHRTSELAAANVALGVELNDRRQAEEQVRGLMRRLITVQEDERRLIARDLHDQLGQVVAGLRLKIDGLNQMAANHGTLQAAIENVQATIAALDRDLDFFTWELRPAALDDLGLVFTLRDFVRQWSKNFGTAADFHTRGLDDTHLGYELETNLYRITQEALNNIHKHASATRVGVILERRDHQVVLIVEDDGVGFERAEKLSRGHDTAIGLLGMQERAAVVGGTIEIETAPGKGTTIFVQAPLSFEANAREGEPPA